jgi:hypothetical protein
MDQAYHTRELAKAYETQGYFRQALDIYTLLNRKCQGNDADVLAACLRLEPLAADQESSNRQARLTVLVEDWVTLWRTTHSLTTLDNLLSQVRSRK